jgi:hypothetical protein
MLPLVAGLGLAHAVAAAPPGVEGRLDLIQVNPHEGALSLNWSDTEERLQGSLRPAPLRAGQPLQVSLDVGSFEGAPFEGPLVITLRAEGSSLGHSVTVKRQGRHWEAEFTPEEEGPHQLDVSFRSTRNKALHASLDVNAAQMPRTLAWGLVLVSALALMGLTVRGLLRAPSPPPSPPAPPSVPPSAGDAPPPSPSP